MTTFNPLGILCLFLLLSFSENTASDLPTNTFEEAENCTNNPVLVCPSFVWLKPSESSHPNRTGYANGYPGGPGCADPIVTYEDEIYIINACHKVYTRIWTATDPNNPALVDTCHQTIKQVDELAPVFDSTPADQVIYTDNMDPNTNDCTTFVNWVYPGVYDNHILTEVTEIVSINGVDTNLKRGQYFPAGFYTVTITAYDFCGNISSISFTINVMCADCHLSCPEDVTTSLGSDISPMAVGVPASYNGNMNCGPLSSSYYLDSSEETGCSGRMTTTRTWYGIFTNMPDNTFSCTQRITLQDNSALTLYNCPADTNVKDNFTAAQWIEPIAIASDNATKVTLTSNYSPGNTFPVGITTVIYTAVDGCGNEATCSFKVSVLTDATYPDCPQDIELMCNPDGTAIVNYNPPTYTGTCTTCPYGGYKTGFIYIGSYNGSNYYCSRSFSTYDEAHKLMAQFGGHLATISSAEENEFIASHIATPTAIIGLSDAAAEGNFVWEDGSPIKYTNWFHMQPNDYNNQDYVEIQKNTGLWNDVDNDSELEFVMEIPCKNVRHLGGPKPGDQLSPGTYTSTYRIGDGCGLDEYCTFDITVIAGLSILCQDDIFVEVPTSVQETSVSWEAPQAYTCCSDCADPDNCVTMTQVAGPPSGSNFFRQSKTEIIYEATDACGNKVSCSFSILVDINSSTERTGNTIASSTITVGGAADDTESDLGSNLDNNLGSNHGNNIKNIAEETEAIPTKEKKALIIETVLSTTVKETKLFPNPVTDFLNIEVRNHQLVEDLSLMDQYGRLLMSKKKNILPINTIEVSNLSKGLYYLMIKYTDGESSTNRVVKL